MSGALDAGIYTYLKTVTGITSLVGTGNNARIYPLKLPQNPTLPAIVFTKISEQHVECMTGSAGLAMARIQFDCWAENKDQAEDLSEALRQALQGYKGSMGSVTVQGVHFMNEMDDFEQGIDDFRIIVDFEIGYSVSRPTF